MLEHGVRTWYFTGNWDAVRDWRNIERWLDELEWTGRQEFNEAEGRERIVNNQSAGWKWTPDLLLFFACVRGAGNTVGPKPSIPQRHLLA